MINPMQTTDGMAETGARKDHVLVTGMARSGTTWLGRMLAASEPLVYVQEPSHIGFDDGFYKTDFKKFLVYVSDSAGVEHHKSFRKIFNHGSRLLERLTSRTGPKLKERLRYERILLRRRRTRQRLLVKDPGVVFSCEWLAANFDLSVVIVVRHPAAVVASWVDQAWQSGPEPLLEQEQLMSDLLAPRRQELESFAGKRCSPFDSAIFHWNAIHTAILGFRERHPDWVFLRHEDLAADSIASLAQVFDRLGLPFTNAIKEYIRYNCESSGVDGPVGQVRRDSKRLVAKWRQKLSGDQIAEIRRRTDEIASEFYGPEFWPAD